MDRFFYSIIIGLFFITSCASRSGEKFKHLVIDVKDTAFKSGKLKENATLQFPLSTRDEDYNKSTQAEKILKCFPNQLNKICSMWSTDYVIKENLDIKEIKISMDGFITNGFTGADEEIRELFIYVASLHGYDLGFDYIVPVKETATQVCTDYYQTIGDNYSSETFKEQACSRGGDITYLLFNDPKNLIDGVFQGDASKIWPYSFLYSEGDTYANIILPAQIEYSKSSSVLYVPEKAYKNYFNTYKLIMNLKEKFHGRKNWGVEFVNKKVESNPKSFLDELKEM